ncbi:MAG: hypothetical protein KME40_05400 [Komarekiella atlantica HA4396-MV6]|jgi:hypothetical protein|nr:hypothetical protein [Komarekiella atlantica HA4396-MV6]
MPQALRCANVIRNTRQRKLKLILTSGGIGAAIALFGFWTYNTLASNPMQAGRSLESIPVADLRN